MCLEIFSYEQATEWSKQIIYLADMNEDDMSFEEWEDYVYDYWIATFDGGWVFDESLEEVIIRAFDELLEKEYDDEDVRLVYGLEEW